MTIVFIVFCEEPWSAVMLF